MKDIVIFGTGSFAEVANFYFKVDSPYHVAAFTAHGEQVHHPEFCQLPVVAFEEIEQLYPPDKYRMFVAVGYKNVNHVRKKICEEAKNKGYTLVSYLSSKSTHWGDTKIGENTFIFENNTIQPFVNIGNNTVIWSGNHIGHHATIGDNCFITSHTVISGHVEIGDSTFIGVNATLRDNIKIGSSCVIGAGALIMKSTRDNEVYVGERTKKFNKTSKEISL